MPYRGNDLGDQLVIGLECGEFLLGELAPLGADLAEHGVARGVTADLLSCVEALVMPSPYCLGVPSLER